MTLKEAIHIAEETQKWRRSQPPYDRINPDGHRLMPYSPSAFGKAVDLLLSIAKNKSVNETDNYNYD